MKANDRMTRWFEQHVISVIARRVLAIVTAQAKKTRNEIETLREDLMEELKK